MKVLGVQTRSVDMLRGVVDASDAYTAAAGLTGQFATPGFADTYAGCMSAVHGLTAAGQVVACLADKREYSCGHHLFMALGDGIASVGFGVAASGGGGLTPILFGVAGVALANFAQYATE